MRNISRWGQRLALKSASTIVRAAREFRDRTDGIAAVEFALIVPIMSVMMIGSIEMSEAVTVDRRVSMTAAATGDLVARYEGTKNAAGVTEGGIRTTEVLDIAKVGTWLMKPYDGTKFKITLSFISIGDCASGPPCSPAAPVATNPLIKTRWKCIFDGAAPTLIDCSCPLTAYAMPDPGLIGYKDAVVVADVEYKYTPRFFDYFMKQSKTSVAGAYTLVEKLHLKPRGLIINLMESDGTTLKCSGSP
jgi:Flp pilus assembly pilin Flp